MWLKLCRNDFLRVSDRLSRCIESISACAESPYMKTTVNGYTRRGETSRDLTYHIKACHGNCMHHPTCVKCAVAWKTALFHDRKSLKNTLHIPETIPSRTETRKKMNSTILIFLVSILKISVIASSRTQWSSFTLLLTLLYWCGRRCKIERCTMFSRLPWKQATKNFLRR